MKHIYTTHYSSLYDSKVDFGVSDSMSDNTHNLRIKAHEVLRADKGGWDTETLIATAEYSFNLSISQIENLVDTLGLFLEQLRPEPTINDIKRSIEESEGVNA